MPDTSPLPIDEADVRARVVAAAREEFAARGLDASRVQSIAVRAGVTPAMINYYFGSKRALYETLVSEAQARLHARLGAALPGDAEGRASRLAAAYFDFLSHEGPAQRLLLREVLEHGGRGPALIRPLRELLDAHFGADDDVVQSALSVFGAIAGYFVYAPVLGELLGRDPLSPDALARRRAHGLHVARLLAAEVGR